MSREFVPVPHATTQGMTQSAGNTRQANPPLRGRAAGTLLESYENCSQMARHLLLLVENRSRGSRATKVTQVTRSFCRSVFVAQSCVWTSAHCAIVGSTSLHGMIFSELRSYAEGKLGPGAWNAVLKRARLEQSVYLPIQEYPDCEASALIAAVSAATRRNLSVVLEDFGEFIAPTLMKLHGHLLLPEWKTIDVIDHTEGTIQDRK